MKTLNAYKQRFTLLVLGISLTCSSIASAQFSIPEAMINSEDTIVLIRTELTDTSVLPSKKKGKAKTARYERHATGVIVDPKGYIVTNTHVVEHAPLIYVILPDGTQLPAKVVSREKDFDFCILKINPPKALNAILWADSDKVQIHDDIVTIGNSSLDELTLKRGKIKALTTSQFHNQTFVDLIRVDIPVDRGNSGGPILNEQGRFVGLVFARQMPESVGLAIPANKIRRHLIKLTAAPSL